MNNKVKKIKPYVLVIIDGWGITENQPDNPIEMAKTPTYSMLWREHIHTTLSASGVDVGLLPGQDGNSEAGHMTIGAGRIIKQDVAVINKSIANGTFFKNAAFVAAIDHVLNTGGDLHLMGLLSDKDSAHSNPDHLRFLIKMIRSYGIQNIFLHLFTDGRDTPKYASIKFLRELEEFLQPNERIATIMGRVYLDRKKDWKKTKKVYDALILGKGNVVLKPEQAIKEAYANGETDEFISPYIISIDKNKKFARMNDKDSIIFFNLRSDRARQLTKPFVQADFENLNKNSFKRTKKLKNIMFVAMTDFGPDLENVLTAYPSADIEGTLPMVLRNYEQLYIAESEKYAHMTYFFNGGYDIPIAGEDRIFVPSPKVDSYEQTPEMSTQLVAKYLIDNIKLEKYDFYGINLASPDMMGHTGNLGAAIKAVESIDKILKEIIDEVLSRDGVLFITADHGNIEEIINIETGEIDTEHSTNPVPFFIVSNEKLSNKQVLPKGALADIAPTILGVMGVKPSREMTGRNLLKLDL